MSYLVDQRLQGVGVRTYILVLHVFEQPQFPVGPLGVDDGLERSGQLLHGDLKARLHVVGRAEGGRETDTHTHTSGARHKTS